MEHPSEQIFDQEIKPDCWQFFYFHALFGNEITMGGRGIPLRHPIISKGVYPEHVPKNHPITYSYT